MIFKNRFLENTKAASDYWGTDGQEKQRGNNIPKT